MNELYEVFMRSIVEDFQSNRAADTGTRLEINCIPGGMEPFPSAGEPQREISECEIEQRECFLLILAGTFGILNQTGVGGNEYRGLRYIEMDYRHTYPLHKPEIACICRNMDLLPRLKTEEPGITRRKLDSFREDVLNIVEVEVWDNEKELCANGSIGLRNALAYRPASGLVLPCVVNQRIQTGVDQIEDLEMQCGVYQAKSHGFICENAKRLKEIEDWHRESGC